MPHEPRTPTTPHAPTPHAPAPSGSWYAVADVPPDPPDPTPSLDVIRRLERVSLAELPPAIPGYDVLRELGRGGMGVVYLARDPRLNRFVALKTVRRNTGHSTENHARFTDEARAVGKLHHSGVVPIHAAGEFEGGLFLAMEYLPGGSLSRWLDGRPCSAHTAARIVLQLCEAVQAAHEAGILHRDIKPANVLLAKPCPHDAPPEVKLADFGLARLDDASPKTASGDAIGTPNYMPPEQAVANRGEMGPASDVYGLGAVLYECLTGRAPFQGVLPLDIVMQVLSQEPVPIRMLHPTVPRDLETVCHKCLAKRPLQRYASARELADDLSRFLADQPVRARSLGVFPRAWRDIRRRPLRVGLSLLGVVALAVAGTSLVVTHQRVDALESRLRQQREQARQTFDVLLDAMPEPDTFADSLPGHKPFLERLLTRFEQFADDDGLEPSRRAIASLKVAELRAGLRRAEAELAALQACQRFETLGDSSAHRQSLARSFQWLGEIRHREARPGADEALGRARALWEQAIAESPADAEPRRCLAVSLLREADRLRRAGRAPDAWPVSERATHVLSTLPESTPREPATVRLLALARLQQAALRGRDGRVAEAESLYRKADTWYAGLTGPLVQQPAVIRERCDALAGLAVCRWLRDQGKDLEAESRQALTDYRRLLAGTDDPATRLGLARLLRHLGRAKIDNRLERDGEEIWAESLRLARPLCAEHPDDEDTILLASAVAVELSYLSRMRGQAAEAVRLCDEAMPRLEWLARRPSPPREWDYWLYQALFNRSEVFAAVGRTSEAITDLRRALEVTPAGIERDHVRDRLVQCGVEARQTALVVEMCEAMTRPGGVRAYLVYAARQTAILAGKEPDAELRARARRAALAALTRLGTVSEPEHADWNAVRDDPAFWALRTTLNQEPSP